MTATENTAAGAREIAAHIIAECDATDARLGGPSSRTRNDREMAARELAYADRLDASA